MQLLLHILKQNTALLNIMRIKLATPLIGEFPRYADVKIPDNAAVIAADYAANSSRFV